MKLNVDPALFGPIRLPFLVLTPVCVGLGAACAAYSGKQIDPVTLFLAMIGALAAHISVNALNEYDDFKTGLDFDTVPTPFSGGSGTLPRHPEKALFARATGWISLALTAAIGMYLTLQCGPGLVPLGILGLVNVIAYTRWLTRNPLFCLIAPGIGFGPVMVMGTEYVLSGSYSWSALVASLIPFFLVSNLLLLNQFPDVAADRKVGRRHLPIAWGLQASVGVYGLFLAGAFLSIILAWLTGVFPAAALLGLLPAVLAAPTLLGVARNFANIDKLIPYMGKNVVVVLTTVALLAVGFLFA